MVILLSAGCIIMCLITTFMIFLAWCCRTTLILDEDFNLPKVGDFVPYYDNGNFSDGNRYMAKVVSVVPIGSAKHRVFRLWKHAIHDYPLFYARKTDVLIYVEIPSFDNAIYLFTRTKNGLWYTLESRSERAASLGYLDVNGKITQLMMESYMKEAFKRNAKLEVPKFIGFLGEAESELLVWKYYLKSI